MNSGADASSPRETHLENSIGRSADARSPSSSAEDPMSVRAANPFARKHAADVACIDPRRLQRTGRPTDACASLREAAEADRPTRVRAFQRQPKPIDRRVCEPSRWRQAPTPFGGSRLRGGALGGCPSSSGLQCMIR